MSNFNINDLFANVNVNLLANVNVNDITTLDQLRASLVEADCTGLIDAEQILRNQLGTMVRASSSFDDLCKRLNEAGSEFLLTRFASSNAQERANRECESARGRLAKEYREDIEGIVDAIRTEIASGSIDDIDDLDTYIHETVDGCERVIYTVQAKEACIFSDNDDAWEECYEPRGSIDWSAMAYWVVRADVLEGLGDIASDEDEFDALRLSKGFTVRWEDVSDLDDVEGDFNPDTEVRVILVNDTWTVQVNNQVIAEIDQDAALELHRS